MREALRRNERRPPRAHNRASDFHVNTPGNPGSWLGAWDRSRLSEGNFIQSVSLGTNTRSRLAPVIRAGRHGIRSPVSSQASWYGSMPQQAAVSSGRQPCAQFYQTLSPGGGERPPGASYVGDGPSLSGSLWREYVKPGTGN